MQTEMIHSNASFSASGGTAKPTMLVSMVSQQRVLQENLERVSQFKLCSRTAEHPASKREPPPRQMGKNLRQRIRLHFPYIPSMNAIERPHAPTNSPKPWPLPKRVSLVMNIYWKCNCKLGSVPTLCFLPRPGHPSFLAPVRRAEQNRRGGGRGREIGMDRGSKKVIETYQTE